MGAIIALAVDATSRGYSLSGLALAAQGAAQQAASPLVQKRANQFFVTLMNDGSSDIYYTLDSAAVGVNEISDTAVTAAGGTIGFDALPLSTCQCAKIPAGVWVDERLDHLTDLTLIVKCASGKTSTLRFWVSSQSMPGAQGPY